MPRLNNGPIRLTEGQFRQLDDDSMGICVKCRVSQGGCEPDARNYECEGCGTRTVYGTAELLIMGCIRIVDDSADAESV